MTGKRGFFDVIAGKLVPSRTFPEVTSWKVAWGPLGRLIGRLLKPIKKIYENGEPTRRPLRKS